ncbi:MAG: hypothetical protein C4576_17475 [Desulfobacteraceae bacterium]|nr:MAG: hypothetical protein C4576_17475 [Desulfobacteraceae bacterium]
MLLQEIKNRKRELAPTEDNASTIFIFDPVPDYSIVPTLQRPGCGRQSVQALASPRWSVGTMIKLDSGLNTAGMTKRLQVRHCGSLRAQMV